MPGASCSPCFAGWQGELIFGLWCILFEGIKKVKRSIIYSSSRGNSVCRAPSVRAVVSHFVWRRSESWELHCWVKSKQEREKRALCYKSQILRESFVWVTTLLSLFASRCWINIMQKICTMANMETTEVFCSNWMIYFKKTYTFFYPNSVFCLPTFLIGAYLF